MLKAVSTVLALVVSLAIVANLSAAEKQRRREGPRPGPAGFDRIEAMVKDLNLTDEQKAKVAELKKEYEPKFKDATGKIDSILTADQKKARDDAMKAAKDAGKNRWEVFQAGMTAVKLTDDQKTKMQEARKGLGALGKEVRDKVMSILTPEQKEQVKKAREKMRQRRSEIN